MVAAIKTVINLYLKSNKENSSELYSPLLFVLASQVFDHVLKRMSVRRQKRWWNAYMLFYCRADLDDPEFEVLKSEFEVGVSCSSSTFVQCISKLASILRLFLRYESISIAKVFPSPPDKLWVGSCDG